jgi:hypothetical protein
LELPISVLRQQGAGRQLFSPLPFSLSQRTMGAHLLRMRMAILFLTVLSGACVSVRSTVLDPSYQVRPVPRDDVFVYFRGDTIPEHSQVAILAAIGGSELTTFCGLLDKLRDEAGKLGANAIITSWTISHWVDEPPPPEIGSADAIHVPSPQRPRLERAESRDTRTGVPEVC